MAEHANTTSPAIYVNQLSERLCRVLPRAVEDFDATAVHQARVTTRRLGAAIELIEPWLRKNSHKKIRQSLRQLRRGLGPLRDLDVMVARLETYRAGHATAVAWLERELAARRSRCGKKLRQGRADFANGQWLDRQAVERLGESQSDFQTLLCQKIQTEFDGFCGMADALMARQAEVDVHVLRISGKRLRYTLEIAAAMGAALSEQIGEQFKRIQDALGQWHDCVVLAQRAMKLAGKRELAMGDANLLGAVLELVKVVVADAGAAIEEFVAAWQEAREGISAAVRQLQSTAPGEATA